MLTETSFFFSALCGENIDWLCIKLLHWERWKPGKL